MSKLQDFLSTNKIDPRRVVAASKKQERRTPADRAIALAKRQVRAGASDEKLQEKAKAKPAHSGKAVTAPLLDRALAGEKISGPSAQRVLRAVNAVLVSKKKSAVAIADLF